ncbi:NAD(P)H-dependent oxidoreductase [Cohnella sp. GCM10027633]|uniref:NAD(P)H-dependent oxidoreductase n=1 Tax=unclassified Cohnella TaxID=2636738 RepID=UPI0036275811
MKNNRIAIIIGHPYPYSYCNALAQAYAAGARRGGAEVRILDLSRMSFDPNLKHGYTKRSELEPDLVAAQETITWAEHLVIVYPNWWGSMPAVLKGFLDRTLLPGFAFKTRPNSLLVDKLLKGRSARVIVTMDSPIWYYRLAMGNAGHRLMKKAVLNFCGIAPVKVTGIGPVKTAKRERLEQELRKIEALGERRG